MANKLHSEYVGELSTDGNESIDYISAIGM